MPRLPHHVEQLKENSPTERKGPFSIPPKIDCIEKSKLFGQSEIECALATLPLMTAVSNAGASIASVTLPFEKDSEAEACSPGLPEHSVEVIFAMDGEFHWK